MASASSSDADKQAQKWIVLIDCAECKKKVTKIVNSNNGTTGVWTVESYEVDIKQQKEVETGNIDVVALLKTLVKKTRKHAKLWPEDGTIHKTKNMKKKKTKEVV